MSYPGLCHPASARKSAPPAPSVELVKAAKPKEKDQVLEELRELVRQTSQQDVNIPVLVAKIVVVFGIFLLDWAYRIGHSDRALATVKIIAALVFSALYPWFTVAVFTGIAIVYVFSKTRAIH